MARGPLKKAWEGSWLGYQSVTLQNKRQRSEEGQVCGQGEPQAVRLSRGKAPGDHDGPCLCEQKVIDVPTLGGSSAHQGNCPAPQAIPAQHREAEAVGSGWHQIG